MGTIYVIYSGERGFWSRSNQFTTDLKQARHFTESEAIEFCQRRKGTGPMDSAISTLPVPLYIAEAILK